MTFRAATLQLPCSDCKTRHFGCFCYSPGSRVRFINCPDSWVAPGRDRKRRVSWPSLRVEIGRAGTVSRTRVERHGGHLQWMAPPDFRLRPCAPSRQGGLRPQVNHPYVH
jgi:hypothetical protein